MDERTTDARLHAYFDGELSPAEAADVRQQLEADPGLRAKLDGLGEVRAVVRASVAPALADVPSDDLWARIEARLEAEEPAVLAADGTQPAADGTQRPGLRVIRGGASAEDAGSERAEDPAPEAPGTERPAAMPAPVDPHRRRRVVGVVIAGLALAAAVLLVVLRPGEPPPGTSPDLVATGDGTPGIAPTRERETAEELVFRTEVLEVDFGDNSGAVFSVEGDDGERYAVVWLADVQPKRTATEQ